MNKVWNFLAEKKYIIMAVVCVALFSLTMKTQVIILKYGDDYAMRMEYSLYGYCVRASASLKATEPAVQNAVYFWGGIDDTVTKAVEQMEILAEGKQTVGVMSSGYPRNNGKLEERVEKLLEQAGYDVEILDVSITDALGIGG